MMEEKIEINGKKYNVIQSEITNPFERMASLQPMEAVRYFGYYMYRTEDYRPRMCYADDPENNFSI